MELIKHISLIIHYAKICNNVLETREREKGRGGGVYGLGGVLER